MIKVEDRPGWPITEEVFRKLAAKCKSVDGKLGGEDKAGTVYLMSQLNTVDTRSTVSSVSDGEHFYLHEMRTTERRGPGWEIQEEAFETSSAWT